MAEALELTYKALRVGLGVVPKQQVVGAEFGVRAVALEHVVGDDEDRVRDSAHGLLVPATTFDSRVLTGEVGLLAAGHRRCGFDERDRNHFEPLRMWPAPRLPADSALPGQRPAQEARCRAVGKRVMS